ncbi:MAG: hypothetical protein KFB93_00490 [Simkaniaceae bacterium]|jgi:hypothetical protein|nr:MAG: hypothetical protein KFB93_00490 [Simkaniaceae bacterium]
MSVIGSQPSCDLIGVDKKIFYTNGMTTSEQETEKISDELRNIALADVEVHHNDTTPTEKIVEIVVKIGIGTVGLCYAATSEKKSNEKKVSNLAIGATSIGLIGWGLADLHEIQRKKEESADQLANKVYAHLQKNPLRHVTLIFHSQGADIGFRTLTQLTCFKNRIHVITIGGKFEIPPSFSKRVTNFVNERDLISGFARAATNPLPGEVKIIRSKKCKTSFCHGTTDYISHPSVRKTIRDYTQKDLYWLDRHQQCAYPAYFV